MKPLLATYSGLLFDLKYPDLTSIEILDIAHALSNLCRFGGHARQFYSVAEHSIKVAEVLVNRWPKWPEVWLAGLLHDAAEAYLVDMPRPAKALIGEAYLEHERRLEEIIRARFHVQWSADIEREVRWADDVCLVTEARELIPHAIVDGTGPCDFGISLECLPPGAASQGFLRAYACMSLAQQH